LPFSLRTHYTYGTAKDKHHFTVSHKPSEIINECPCGTFASERQERHEPTCDLVQIGSKGAQYGRRKSFDENSRRAHPFDCEIFVDDTNPLCRPVIDTLLKVPLSHKLIQGEVFLFFPLVLAFRLFLSFVSDIVSRRTNLIFDFGSTSLGRECPG